MYRTVRFFFYLSLMARIALGDELPASDSNKVRYEVGTQLSLASKRFESGPFGFGRETLDPPQTLFAGLRLPWRPGVNPVDGLLRTNVSFIRPFGAPLLGFEGGAEFSLLGLSLETTLFAQFQSTLSGSFQSSQFETDWYGLTARASLRGFSIVPKVGVRWIMVADTTVGAFESIETSIAHAESFVFWPSVEFSLPLGIALETGIEIASLGNLAIASKEFAFAIPKRTLYRYHLAAGVRFSSIEIWGRFASLDKVEDVEEHFYQAPFYYGAYYLAPQTATMELKWKF